MMNDSTLGLRLSEREVAPAAVEWQHVARSAARLARQPASGVVRRLLGRIAREPFIHFLLLGTVLFAFNHYLEERARFTRITITKSDIQGILDNYQLQYGGLPSPQQLDALVEQFVREEIFYHEALKLGLDVDDEIIRRRLVQKYEFLQQDLATPAEPTDAQLLGYYEQHPEHYRLPETVTFTHVYFSTDLHGEAGARRAAQDLATTLNLRGVTRAVDQGDRFPGNHDFASLCADELARVFGKEGLAQTIFAVDINRWSPPLRSGLGWHTVYVSGRRPSRQQAFADVRAEVRRDYIEAERERRNAERLAKLRQRFVIIRE
jgi:peptidyl-prolyl cis-trans isomerase C